MKFTAILMMICTCLFVNASFAQMSRTLPVSLTLTGDRLTSFEVYHDATSTTPLTELALSSGGHTINDDVQYIAGELYLDIERGNTGSWHVLMYTSNDVPQYAYYPNSFSSDQANNLLATDGSFASLQWKYNHSVRLVAETKSIGATITSYDWSCADTMYIFMVNIPPLMTPADFTLQDLYNAQIVTYQTNQSLSSANLDDRIRITFGVDLSSSCRAATYTANLNIEVYYE